jgi:hypothetical protein
LPPDHWFNLLLVPILTFILHSAGRGGLMSTNPDAYLVLVWIRRINLGLSCSISCRFIHSMAAKSCAPSSGFR